MIVNNIISDLNTQLSGSTLSRPEHTDVSTQEAEKTAQVMTTETEASTSDNDQHRSRDNKEQQENYQQSEEKEQNIQLYKPGDTFRVLGNAEDFEVVTTGNNAYLKHVNGGVIALSANLERTYIQFNNQSAQVSAVLKAKITRAVEQQVKNREKENNTAQDSSSDKIQVNNQKNTAENDQRASSHDHTDEKQQTPIAISIYSANSPGKDIDEDLVDAISSSVRRDTLDDEQTENITESVLEASYDRSGSLQKHSKIVTEQTKIEA
ncbi:hypothetical protein [Oceanospirillum sediminis]|uniref:Uncharacterized protein n=1 Tax=Oceanospirillum sediminis TaxID=2760088 RepID=A0A839IX80_9GAMM|nr:hypothetical protein [Oceanospirillum sediminis]MBB1489300.1 hypothetical protein [Oceanospirillum sediminis]